MEGSFWAGVPRVVKTEHRRGPVLRNSRPLPHD